VRAGVARERGFAFAVLRTVIVPSRAIAGVGDASGYFFVVGQISRHGCVFIVSLNCLMFSPAGCSSFVAIFNLSDDARRFCNVPSILLLSVRLVLIFSMLVSECERALSGFVRSERCSPNVLNCVRARFSSEFWSVSLLRFWAVF